MSLACVPGPDGVTIVGQIAGNVSSQLSHPKNCDEHHFPGTLTCFGLPGVGEGELVAAEAGTESWFLVAFQIPTRSAFNLVESETHIHNRSAGFRSV